MKITETYTLAVIVGSLLILLLSISVIYLLLLKRKLLRGFALNLKNKDLQHKMELDNTIEATRLQERNLVAANLHNGIGAELSLLKLNLSKYSYFLKNNIYIQPEKFAEDVNQLNCVIHTVRSVCKELNLSDVAQQGFIKSCETFSNKLSGSNIIKSSFRTELTETDLWLNDKSKHLAFSVFLEVSNNLIKHSGCTNVEVRLTKTKNACYQIIWQHNGLAFNNRDAETKMALASGVGLACMRQKAKELKGSIDYLGENGIPSVYFTFCANLQEHKERAHKKIPAIKLKKTRAKGVHKSSLAGKNQILTS